MRCAGSTSDPHEGAPLNIIRLKVAAMVLVVDLSMPARTTTRLEAPSEVKKNLG